MTLDKKGNGPRPLGALRSMPMVNPELRKKVKQRQRPSTAMSMKDYLDSEEEKRNRVDEMQDRVNEAVKDYMSNLIKSRAPEPQQPIIIAQPIAVPVNVPVAAPPNQFETFVSAGLDLLERDMPPTPPQTLRVASARSRAVTPAVSVKPADPPRTLAPRPSSPMKVTVQEHSLTPMRPSSPFKPRPASPVKSLKPSTPCVRPASAVKSIAVSEKLEQKLPNEDETKAIADDASPSKAACDIKRPDQKFDRHWLTWPRTPSVASERSKTPATALYRPKNPTKLRRSKTSFDRPTVYTPLPNEFVELDPRPPSGEPPTLNFVPGEPTEYGKAVPYVPAFQSWMKGASTEEKGVVYNMMKSLKAQQINSGPSHARYVSYSGADKKKNPANAFSHGVRTSVPAFRPPDMYAVPDGQHPNACNSCEDYLIKTWAHQAGAAPDLYGIGYSRYCNSAANMYDYNDFSFSRNSFNWEESKPFAAPQYYRNVEYRPMAKHQHRVPVHKDYRHENSHFQDAQKPYRSHYIIFPDWVSENSHFKKQRQLNGHKYHY